MKKLFFIFITLIFAIGYGSAQEMKSKYVKGRSYEGYIFSKDHSIWGFPPESDRYTPTEEDIVLVERILKDSISSDIVKSAQYTRRPMINKRTLKRYIRQYVGFVTENNEKIIWVNMFRRGSIEIQDPLLDIILINDGGYYYWQISINITTRELLGMSVNGEA